MPHICYLFPVCKQDDRFRLNSFSNWWQLELDITNDNADLADDIDPSPPTISGSLLMGEICRHSDFPEPPSFSRLDLYDVSADEHESLRRSLPDPSFDLARIRQAPRLFIFDKIPISRCQFIIAAHAPLVDAVAEVSLTFPTLQGVPPGKRPIRVTLPDAEVPPKELSITKLKDSILVCAATYGSLSMDDCSKNHIQNKEAIVPQPPGWVETFIADMSRRREVLSSVCRDLCQIYRILTKKFRGF